jgi:hypothetical protein
MTTLKQKLEEIKNRVNAATPGPWESFENGPHGGLGFGICTNPDDTKAWFLNNPADNSNQSSKNASFISHSRTDIETLLAIVEKAIEMGEFYGDAKNMLYEEKINGKNHLKGREGCDGLARGFLYYAKRKLGVKE